MVMWFVWPNVSGQICYWVRSSVLGRECAKAREAEAILAVVEESPVLSPFGREFHC